MTIRHGIRTSIGSIPTPPSAISPTVIFIVGTGTGTPGTGDLVAIDTPTEVESTLDAQAKFGVGSILDFATEAFILSRETIWAVRYDSTLTGAALITAVNENVDRVRLVSPRPTVLIVPSAAEGLTWLRPAGVVDTSANAIGVRMNAVAESMGILAIIDGDRTDRSDAEAWAALNGGPSSLICSGVVGVSGVPTLAFSSYLAARIAALDRDRGVHSSVSNKVATGVISRTPDWSFDYEDALTDAQVLDMDHVTTCVFDGTHFRVWGGTLKTVNPNDPLRFMGPYRITQQIRRRAVAITSDLVDEDLSPTFPEEAAGALNRMLRGQINRGRIAAGHYFPDPNHVADLENGDVYIAGYIQAIGHARLIDVSTRVTLGSIS